MTLIVCSLTGAFVFIDTLGYPTVKTQGFGGGPAFYPQVLAGTLVGLAILIVLQDLRQKKPAGSLVNGDSDPTRDNNYRSIAVLMCLCVASILAMRYAGFLLSGFLLTFLSVLLIKPSSDYRQIILYFLYSLSLMALVYVVFELLVGIQLPGSSLR